MTRIVFDFSGEPVWIGEHTLEEVT